MNKTTVTMKRNFWCIILIFCASNLNAQQGIYGTVVNQKEVPLAMLEFRLLNKDSVALQAVLSNKKGEYGFDISDTGTYILEAYASEDLVYRFYNIEVKKDKPIYFDVAINKERKADKPSAANKQTSLSSKRLEKLPTVHAVDYATVTSKFVNNKSGAAARSVLGGGPTRYIVDGMVIPENSSLIFTPGSLQSVDVIGN
jgi:hypothetical protein